MIHCHFLITHQWRRGGTQPFEDQMLNTPWSNYEPAAKIENVLLVPTRQYKETFHLMFGLTFVHCIKFIVPNLIIWKSNSCKTFDKLHVSKFVWYFIQHMGPKDPSNKKKYPSFFLSQIIGNCKTNPKM